jgi:hypothetical protein
MRPESITAIVFALIPLSVMLAVGFAAALWLGSPSSEPPVHAGSGPISQAVAVQTVPYAAPMSGGDL